MSPPRAVGGRRIGQVMIAKKGVKKFVGGSYQVFQGISVKKVFKALKKDSQQFLDYYVFEQRHSNPKLNTVVVFAGAADEYNRARGDRSPITLMQINQVGTMLRMKAAKFVGMVDRKGSYPVRNVVATIPTPLVVRLNARQKKLKSMFVKRLKKLVGGKKMGVIAIGRAVQQVAREFSVLCASVEQPQLQLIQDPKGTSGAKAVTISVKLTANPEGVKLSGIPKALRKRVLAAIEKGLKKVLAKHPALKSGTAVSLTRSTTGGVVTWSYTASKSSRGVKGAERWPDIVKGQPMPIPPRVFLKAMAFMQKKLYSQAGVYQVKYASDTKGVVQVTVRNHNRPQIVIPQSIVDSVRKQIGIDLSAEKKILDGGTKRWSGAKTAKFIEALSKKFLAKGRELLTEHPQFLGKRKDGKVEIRPFSMALIKPSTISITGDVNLKGIGGTAALKRILGTKSMTRAQLMARLKKIEAHVHKAGYLVLGENPGRTTGIQLTMGAKRDGSLYVDLRVARMGSVIVSGAIPQATKAALIKAVQGVSGKPIHAAKLQRAIKKALKTLKLTRTSGTEYIMRLNGRMDVLISVKR